MRAPPWLAGRCVGFVVLASSGCVHAEHSRAETVAPSEDVTTLVASLKKNEADVLSTLARGDPRIAARMPTLVAPPEGEASDSRGLYSAQVRARSLDEAEALFKGWGNERQLRASKSGATAPLKLERELLERVLMAERFRVDEEADLPRAGSEIIRGIVLVGGDPTRAPWVTRRIDEIRLLLRPESLTALEAAELDDALDPLERGAPTSALAAIAGLRVALADIKVAPSRAPEPDRIARALKIHLGAHEPLAVYRDTLEHAESALRAEVVARSKRVSGDDVRFAESHAEQLLGDGANVGAVRATGGSVHLAGAERCAEGDPDSFLRAALPPPERGATCQALAVLAVARGDVETLSTLIALHDGVAVALWALASRAFGMDPDRANERWRMLAAIPPERQARIVRAAVTRPVSAIALGLAVAMVARAGLQDAPRAARAWRHFGDAPFDVILRENALSAPLPTASPRP